MSAPRILRIPLDEAFTLRSVAVSGHRLVPVDVPKGSGAVVRIDSQTADPIPLDGVGGVDACFSRIFVSADAVPGTELVIAVASECGSNVLPRGGGGEGEPVGQYFAAEPTPAANGARVPLLCDAVGRVYVRLGDRLSDVFDSIATVPMTGASVTQTWTAVQSAAGNVQLAMDTGGRSVVAIRANVSAAAQLQVIVSRDGVTFHVVETINQPSAGDVFRDLKTAWRWVGVRCVTGSIIFTADVSAKGA